jgi:hypothetical protein
MQQLKVARQQIDRTRKGPEDLIQCKFCDKKYDTHTGMTLHVWKIHGEGVNNDPNAGYKNGTRHAWSKGLTKESDDRIARISEKVATSLKGKPGFDLRKPRDLEKLSDYRHACRFNFNLADFLNEFDFSLVEQFGWYKAKNHGDNLNGVSRDHMVSVMFGFKHNIDPSIISHPANCKLLRHNDNVSKGSKCLITIDELTSRIQKRDEKYGKL